MENQPLQPNIPELPTRKFTLLSFLKKYSLYFLAIFLIIFIGIFLLLHQQKSDKKVTAKITPPATPTFPQPSPQITPPDTVTIQRKINGRNETVASFPSKGISTPQIQRWKDFLFYTKALQSNSKTTPIQLIMYDIKTNKTNVIYDTNQFNSIAEPFWDKSISSHNEYLTYLNFKIIDNTLFFSVKTEGYDGYNPGPGVGYYFSLPINTLTPQKFSDKSGFIIYTQNHYWYNGYINPDAEDVAIQTFNLFDPATKVITPIAEQGPPDNLKQDSLIGITTTDQMILKHASYSDSNFSNPQTNLVSISLTKPYATTQILSNSEIPDGNSDIALLPSDKLLFLGNKAFYLYDLQSKTMNKIVDYNVWSGDKITPPTIGNKPIDNIYTEHVDDINVYFLIGNLYGGPLKCGVYTFSTNTYKNINPYYTNANCIESSSNFLSGGPHGPNAEPIGQALQKLNLPEDFTITAN